MYAEVKWSYSDIESEFRQLIPEWDNLEGYVTDAIIRDAMNRGNEFWRFWDNDPKFTENGRITAIRAFVKNYIERIDKHVRTPKYIEPTYVQFWTHWGKLLRELEIGD